MLIESVIENRRHLDIQQRRKNRLKYGIPNSELGQSVGGGVLARERQLKQEDPPDLVNIHASHPRPANVYEMRRDRSESARSHC